MLSKESYINRVMRDVLPTVEVAMSETLRPMDAMRDYTALFA
jgi:hypothetical protein